MLYHMQYVELTCLNEGPGLYPHLRALICCSALNGSSCCSSPIFFCFSFFSFVFPFVFCLFATRGVGNWEAGADWEHERIHVGVVRQEQRGDLGDGEEDDGGPDEVDDASADAEREHEGR